MGVVDVARSLAAWTTRQDRMHITASDHVAVRGARGALVSAPTPARWVCETPGCEFGRPATPGDPLILRCPHCARACTRTRSVTVTPLHQRLAALGLTTRPASVGRKDVLGPDGAVLLRNAHALDASEWLDAREVQS